MYDNAVVAAQPATSTSGPRESNLKSLKNGQQQTVTISTRDCNEKNDTGPKICH